MLVGRDRDLALLAGRLAERRLVTVIGPGGIGKTALARAAAARVAAGYARGARVVDLTKAATTGEVEEAIAAQLGFQTFQVLLDAPVDLSVLLLVDNCEHVSRAAADAVAAILDACAAPTVLATSRSPLDLPGEAVVALGPLTVPPPGVVDPEAAAVRLFAERVRDAGTELAEGDLDAVCELCRHLDGIPLALEIAAARIRSMSPAEVLARLDEHPDLLSRPRWRGAAHHRSLRATIEWSYRLLDPPTRDLFDRLGVFSGPFTAEMAHAVAAPRDAAGRTLDLLDGLVAASLVTAERTGSRTWYRLLQAPRAYAAQQLAASGELAAAGERLAAYAAAQAEAIVDRAELDWDAALVAPPTGDQENLVTALRWSLAHDTEPDRALLLVAALWAVVHQTRTEDVAALGEHALAAWPDPAHARWAGASATVATALFLLGRHDAAVGLAQRALDVTGPGPARPLLLRVVGLTRLATGAGGTVELFTQAAAQARAAGVEALAIELDIHRAESLAAAGRPDDAVAQLAACATGALRAGSRGLEVYARTVEGHVRLHLDPAAATPVIERALADARHMAFPAAVVTGLCALAVARLAAGRVADSARTALEMLDALSLSGIGGFVRMGLETAAAVLHRLDRPAASAIAATARTLPPRCVVVGVPRHLLPAGDGSPLAVREAVTLARRELRERASAAPPPPPEPARGVLHKAGDVWDVRFGGHAAGVRHSKGMTDLAQLLAHPYREIHCVQLAGAAVDQQATGDVIDRTARRAYEQRIRDLQAELDDAEAAHDLVRAEKAAAELDALVDQLSAALGLGGRGRRTGSSAERARSAVTQRIRATIRRICEVHPRLGRHLELSVRTGTYSSYRPEEPVAWDIVSE